MGAHACRLVNVCVCVRACACVCVCVWARARAGCYRVSVRLSMCVRAHTHTCPQLTAARPRGRLRCGPEGPRGPCAVRDPRGGRSRGPQPSGAREVFQGVSQKQAQPGPPASGTMGPFSRPADGWPVAMTTSIVGRLSGRSRRPPPLPRAPPYGACGAGSCCPKKAPLCLQGMKGTRFSSPPFSPPTPRPAPRPQKVSPGPRPEPRSEFPLAFALPGALLPLPPTLGVPSSATLECGVQTRGARFGHPREPFPARLRSPGPRRSPLRSNSTTFRSRELIAGPGRAGLRGCNGRRAGSRLCPFAAMRTSGLTDSGLAL